MIEEKSLISVGKFQRTHALKGELNALLDIDPWFFTEEDNPMIVEMEGSFVPFFVDSVRTKGQTSFIVKIDRIDSEEQARRFVNKAIFADRQKLKEFLAETGEELIDSSDFEGYKVYDTEAGLLGVPERIDDSTANVLLIVRTPEDEELFLPFADEFISEIDPENKKIVLNLPDGLLGL